MLFANSEVCKNVIDSGIYIQQKGKFHRETFIVQEVDPLFWSDSRILVKPLVCAIFFIFHTIMLESMPVTVLPLLTFFLYLLVIPFDEESDSCFPRFSLLWPSSSSSFLFTLPLEPFCIQTHCPSQWTPHSDAFACSEVRRSSGLPRSQTPLLQGCKGRTCPAGGDKERMCYLI